MAYRFVFTYEDKQYVYTSLKVREVEQLEELLKADVYDANGRVVGKRPTPYLEIAPFTTMKHKLAVMALFLRRDHTEDEVAAIIDGLDLAAVQDMWDFVEDDLPTEFEDGLPLPEAATSTDT